MLLVQIIYFNMKKVKSPSYPHRPYPPIKPQQVINKQKTIYSERIGYSGTVIPPEEKYHSIYIEIENDNIIIDFCINEDFVDPDYEVKLRRYDELYKDYKNKLKQYKIDVKIYKDYIKKLQEDRDKEQYERLRKKYESSN
jgi:hypothetical protein